MDISHYHTHFDNLVTNYGITIFKIEMNSIAENHFFSFWHKVKTSVRQMYMVHITKILGEKARKKPDCTAW